MELSKIAVICPSSVELLKIKRELEKHNIEIVKIPEITKRQLKNLRHD